MGCSPFLAWEIRLAVVPVCGNCRSRAGVGDLVPGDTFREVQNMARDRFWRSVAGKM
jgi:hypothetical protein